MQIYPDCLPCFLGQVLKASRLTTDDEDIQKRILKETISIISRYEDYRYAPELGRDMHAAVKRHTGLSDPYREIKKKSIKAAKAVYPMIKDFLDKREGDRMYWALKAAAAGNVIDYAINSDIDINKCVEEELDRDFAVCDIKAFESALQDAQRVLIIGDNAGETVFDRVLAEELVHKDLTYAVRSEPIINDAVYEDAVESCLDESCTIISSGCTAPGLILEECTEDFKRLFREADVVISKGQGNFETLSDAPREIFYLLKVKCPVVSQLTGAKVNDCIFKLGGAT